MPNGKVFLIGAGPGDPGLITLKGAEALARADVVVYDRLAGRALLELARDDAELVDVGKEPGHHAVPQDEINRMLVDKALAGQTVARLKGGDPFVFGRGGEEALALAERGVEFEVVPGVTSAVAVPAYAGIPVTHRGHSSAVHIISARLGDGPCAGPEGGRGPGAAGATAPDWDVLGRLEGTLVFLMGAESLPDIAANLTRAGRPPDTPAAVIERGTLPTQRTVSGTLGDIAGKASAAGVKPPVITVIGKVASLGPRLAWYRPGLLAGKTIVVTRARSQTGPLAERLRDLGAEVLLRPLIKIAGPADFGAVDHALGRLGEFTHLVFTSPNGVDHFWTRLLDLGLDCRRLAGLKVCAVGPGTAGALAGRGIRADIVPEVSTTAALLARLRDEPAAGRFLVARSDLAGPELAAGLRQAGHQVEDVVFYRTLPAGQATRREPADAPTGPAPGGDRPADYIIFTSPSTVGSFVAVGAFVAGSAPEPGAAPAPGPGTTFVYIGPVTAGEARKAGLPAGLVADPHTIDGVVGAIVDHATRKDG